MRQNGNRYYKRVWKKGPFNTPTQFRPFRGRKMHATDEVGVPP